jgi:tetratricopeptide (TPR) repeat protein
VLGVAGLLTLAQGLFAFFSAQNYINQANEAVKKIEGLDAQVRSKYPMFSDIEEQRKTAFNTLAGHIRRLKVDENLYEVLDPVKRQEIFALENFAAIQFLTSADGQPGVIECLGRLGRFYQDKFKSEKMVLRTDFERAQYYFTKAVQKSNRTDISALNDLGSLLCTGKDTIAARALFEESLAVCPEQQRALYDLGNIFFDTGEFEKALDYYKRAAETKNWEKSPDADMVTALKLVAEVAAPPRSIVDDDLDLATGDLYELAQSSRFSPQVARIREAFKQGWSIRASHI